MANLKRIRIAGRSGGRCEQGDVTVGGLTPDEIDSMEAFTLGCCWIRVSEDGRLERRDRFAKLPDPVDDPCQPPQWIPSVDWTKESSFLCNPTPPLPEEPNPKYSSPAFMVKYLCGYNNTPYDYEARKLQSYGFECLRSRRGRDGRFWEIWYLPGYWSAKGELKNVMALKPNNSEQVSVAVDFLCRHVSFGTLDVCYQRAAMVVD